MLSNRLDQQEASEDENDTNFNKRPITTENVLFQTTVEYKTVEYFEMRAILFDMERKRECQNEDEKRGVKCEEGASKFNFGETKPIINVFAPGMMQ